MLTVLLQLEDDVITKPGYLTIMKDFVLSQKMNDWILLEFSHLGFIGDYYLYSQRVVESIVYLRAKKSVKCSEICYV